MYMKRRLKQIVNNVGMIHIIAILLVFNLIIGSNDKELPILPIGIFMGISMILLLVKKAIFKEKLIKSKVDFMVSVFMFILFLPLIFNTYCTLQGTVEFLIKYFFIYSTYLLIRNIVNTQRKVDIVITATILCSLITIILGIDIQHKKYFNWIIDSLNLKYSDDYRFSSIFGYANATSIYVSFCIFLATYKIENEKNKIIRVLYFLYIILGTYIIYISYSRVVLLAYICSISGYVIYKIYNKIKKSKKKLIYCLSVFILIILTICIYFIIAMQYSKPYEAEKSFRLRRDFIPNELYTIDFIINVTNTEYDYENATLQVFEVNEYLSEKELSRVTLNEGRQIKEISITPSSNMKYIKFKIIGKNNKKVFIEKCYINNEEFIIRYKYIPQIITRLITSFSLNDDSIILRKQFYKDCLRIAKDSIIVGHGGDTWKYLSYVYQKSPYSVKESHSYFFELLISYGLVGTIAFIVVLLLFFIQFLKSRQKRYISVFIGLIVLVLYSLLFDFCMSFIVISLTVFTYIALLQYKNEENINIRILDYFALICLSITFIVLLKANFAKYLVKSIETKKEIAPFISSYQIESIKQNEKNDLKSITEYMKKEPYQYQNQINKLYWKEINKESNELTKEELFYYIDFGIERLENVKPALPMYFDTVIERTELMEDIIRWLENMQNNEAKNRIDRIKVLIDKEYRINISNIEDTDRNKKSTKERDLLIEKYKRVLEKKYKINN